MHTIYECLGIAALDCTNGLRHDAVGKQHELLHQLVGILRLLEIYTKGMSLLINVKPHLNTVKTQGTICKTFLPQDLGQRIKSHYLILELIAGQRFLLTLLLPLNYSLYFLVCEPTVTSNNGTRYTGTFYNTSVCHLHYDRKRELILVLTQRAQIVA